MNWRKFILLGLLASTTGCLRPPGDVRSYKNLEYGRTEGKRQLLDLYVPKVKPANGPIPLLVWIHGGAWKSGSKDRCPLVLIAGTQYAVASINYRLSNEAKFPAQLDDCRSALTWLSTQAEQYGFDPRRIALVGASSGGHLSSLVATTQQDSDSFQVQAVCALFPPTDLNQLVTSPYWRKSSRSDVARLIGGPIEQNLEKVAAANPIHYVTNEDPPFFILHGTDDKVVPIQQSHLLVDALRKHGVPVTFREIKGKGHGFLPPAAVRQEILDFLEERLATQQEAWKEISP